MAGLLDFLNSDDARLGMGLLAAAGPQTDPEKTSLGYAMQSAVGQVDAAKKQRIATLLAQSQMAENIAQAQERQSKVGLQAQQAAFLQNPYMPDGKTFNVQGALQVGFKPEDIGKYVELRNAGRDKVARTIESTDADGRPVTYQVDDYGNRIGEGMAQWKAPIVVNRGGSEDLVSPIFGTVQNSFAKSVSPDAQLSANTSRYGTDTAATTARGNAWLTDQRERERMAKEGTKALTEDQSKQTQNYTDAQNAYNDLLKVAVGKDGKLTSAVNRSGGEWTGAAIGTLPFAGKFGAATGNVITGATNPERQTFISASNALSQALLRSKSGASTPDAETEREVRNIVPQWYDNAAEQKRKIDNLPIALQALRARTAGGAEVVDKIIANKQPVVTAGAGTTPKPAIAPPPTPANKPDTKLVDMPGAPGSGKVTAKLAPNGLYYVPDPARPGKYLQVPE